MAEILRILIVEDHQPDIQSYKDAIRTVNEEYSDKFKVEPQFRTTKDEGLKAIQEMKDELHGAILDLKLSTGEPVDVNEGNELIDQIYEKLRFPVLVLTNTPNGVDAKFKKSTFLEVIEKTAILYTDALRRLIDIYETGIIKILGRKGLIEEKLDGIFWKNIATTLPEWISIEKSERRLLRYTLTHLQEHLEIDDDGHGYDLFHPIESYIIPSIKMHFCTGDILVLKSEPQTRFIILTPACDLAPHGGAPKAKDVLLAEIQPFSNGLFADKVNCAKKEADDENEKKKVLQAREDLRKLIANNYSPKYYYLPNVSLTKGGLINFQKLRSVRFSQLPNDYEKAATVAPQFVKDIIARFSFYYSRQGSPDFNVDAIENEHLSPPTHHPGEEVKV